MAVPENNLILELFLLTSFSTRAVSKNLGSVLSLRIGMLGFPFTYLAGSDTSHLYHNSETGKQTNSSTSQLNYVIAVMQTNIYYNIYTHTYLSQRNPSKSQFFSLFLQYFIYFSVQSLKLRNIYNNLQHILVVNSSIFTKENI